MIPQPIIFQEEAQIKILPPRPEPLTMRQTKWFSVFSEDDEFMMCLPEKDFENLGLNIYDMLRFIKNQRSLLDFHETDTE
jgi:hypothetical protein